MISDVHLANAHKLDELDALRHFRNKFVLADSDMIYLDGNSLGRLPKTSEALAGKVVNNEWGEQLISGWNNRWYSLAAKLGEKLSILLGAKPHEVIFTDNTSTNLFKLGYAALHMQKSRKKIVVDAFNFPSDHYILQGLAALYPDSYTIQVVRSTDGISMDTESLKHAIDSETALVCLSHVGYQTSFRYDMKEITALAHDSGALILWDLSHSTGAVPVDLNACNVDFAVGCSYKYLNGGPGAPAYLYVRDDLIGKCASPIRGWFGDARPFAFNLNYVPAEGIQRFLSGTPPVLSLSLIEPALDIILAAGMQHIWNKGKQQTIYLMKLLEELQKNFPELCIASPGDVNSRGSHITIEHPEACRITQAFTEPRSGAIRVVPDFRKPHFIRMGIAPLYTSFSDIFKAVERLEEILQTKEYLKYSEKISGVT